MIINATSPNHFNPTQVARVSAMSCNFYNAHNRRHFPLEKHNNL